jgi:uncharacterized protein (TIGR03067 family)
MKRLVTLLLALGILLLAAPIGASREDKDKKDKDKDKAEEKKDKDKDKEKKPEEKLTDEQKKELVKLSGTFTVTLFERDGEKTPPDKLKQMKVIQKGADWSFHQGDDITLGKDKVYPDKKPKQIDSVYTNGPANGKTVLGIYEITDDTIKYCWAEPGKERPKDFATKADSGLTLMVLKRTKEEKPDEKDKDKGKDKDKDKEKPKDKDKDKDKDKKDKDKDKAEEKKDKDK